MKKVNALCSHNTDSLLCWSVPVYCMLDMWLQQIADIPVGVRMVEVYLVRSAGRKVVCTAAAD